MSISPPPNRHQAERLQEIFKNYGVALPIVSELSVDGKEKEWAIVVGPLRRGFRTPSMILLTEEDIVGPKKRTVKHKWEGVDEFLNSFKDLAVGEYIVHVENGIGVYRGIKKLSVEGSEKDFLLIEYQDEDRLYVPVDSLELVQKYVGGEKIEAEDRQARGRATGRIRRTGSRSTSRTSPRS